MELLTDREKQACARNVQRMILAAVQEATVWRSAPGENLFGREDEAFAQVARIPVEMRPTPPVDLPGGVDALASAPPDADVRARDRLELDGDTWRVQTLAPERLFGVVTHLTLQLARIHHGGSQNG